MQRQTQIFVLIGILVVAVSALAAVLFFGTTPILRLGIGLLLLVPILWAGNRLGIVEHATDLLNVARAPRRYDKLRSHVRTLLREIKRLNWTAVDAERGHSDPDATRREMDAIENRLKQIVGQLRSAAGEASAKEENVQEGVERANPA